jgi:hypothetical protein
VHAKTAGSGGYRCRRRCCRGNAILARALPLRNSVLVVTMDHTAFDGGGEVGPPNQSHSGRGQRLNPFQALVASKQRSCLNRPHFGSADSATYRVAVVDSDGRSCPVSDL